MAKVFCITCIRWKKDYGIWAHNRWTRINSERGFCLNEKEIVDGGESRKGDKTSCKEYQSAPPKKESFP